MENMITDRNKITELAKAQGFSQAALLDCRTIELKPPLQLLGYFL